MRASSEKFDDGLNLKDSIIGEDFKFSDSHGYQK